VNYVHGVRIIVIDIYHLQISPNRGLSDYQPFAFPDDLGIWRSRAIRHVFGFAARNPVLGDMLNIPGIPSKVQHGGEYINPLNQQLLGLHSPP
jgi:hypothetical protein